MNVPPALPPIDSRLKRFLLWFSLLLAAGYTFLDYWNYNRMGREDPHEWVHLLAGRGIAPAQYRVGVLRTAALFARFTHLQLRHGFGVIDFVCLLVGLASLLVLLRRSHAFRASTPAGQWNLALGFFAVFELFLFWTFWFQKPETMATFAFLALSALLAGTRGRPALSAVLMLLLAAVQATVRSDAAVAFHLGMLIACFLPAGRSMPLRRGFQSAVSITAIAAALCVQWFIAHRIYPAAQRNVSAFQLLTNLHSSMGYAAIVLSLAPYGLILWLVITHWRTLDGWSHGLVLGSVIHFAMFYTLGMAEEVRIFLPYAMTVLPVGCPLLAGWLLPAPEPVH